MAEDILEQLDLWGLTEGFMDTPLRDVEGDFSGLEVDENNNVKIFLTDVTVHESVEPWESPEAEIQIARPSNRLDSKWGVFAISIRRFLPQGTKLAEVVGQGHILRLKYTPGHNLPKKNDDGTWGKAIQHAWEAVGWDGDLRITESTENSSSTSASSSRDRAMQLLEGKTLEEFNLAAIQDSAIRNDTSLVKAIGDKSFVNEMVSSGTFKLGDDSRYVKV